MSTGTHLAQQCRLHCVETNLVLVPEETNIVNKNVNLPYIYFHALVGHQIVNTVHEKLLMSPYIPLCISSYDYVGCQM
uniref:Uncharacterized protein n=1 Tax=Arundo donax TaxID=35708 RepID=A0A0A9CZN0_ARUDO